jgi:hypothetical protein
MEKISPFPILFNMGEMLQGYQTVRALATSSEHLIPGHDPLVMKRYPSPESKLTGTVVRLDVPPRRDT